MLVFQIAYLLNWPTVSDLDNNKIDRSLADTWIFVNLAVFRRLMIELKLSQIMGTILFIFNILNN